MSKRYRSTLLLNTMLVTYFIFVIGIATLVPFRFDSSLHPRVMWLNTGGLFEVLANILLFFPFGYLYRLACSGRDGWLCINTFIAGVAVSCIMEFIQLWLPGRYSSMVDVFVNGFGAWLGAVFQCLVRHRLNRFFIKQMILEMPMMNLFYLFVPLLWLTTSAAAGNIKRLWWVLILGLCGSQIFIAIWIKWLRPAQVLRFYWVPCIILLWFLIGTIPGYFEQPKFMLLCAVVVLFFAMLQMAFPFFSRLSERRLERPILRWVGAYFLLYLILMVLYPWPWIPHVWQLHIGLFELRDSPGIVPLMRLLEYFGAFTLFGYILAEYRGRLPESTFIALLWVIFWTTLWVGVLEFIRGFHPKHTASLVHAGLALLASIYGAVIYRLQLYIVKYLVAKNP